MKNPIRKKERTSGIVYVTPCNENCTNVREKTMNSSKVNIHLKSYVKWGGKILKYILAPNGTAKIAFGQ